MKSIPILLLLFFIGIGVYAQNTVTQDDVDKVASRMYCPVCENEPLDACYNATCIQWKEEIRRQLEAGRTPDQIVEYFVTTYGEHVVGMPQNLGLKVLSYIAPFLGLGIAIVIAFMTFKRWQLNSPKTSDTPVEKIQDDNNYRSQIERDVS
jgi:cytochrome c-type biogenesis protein CcmH